MSWWEPILVEYRAQPGLSGAEPPVVRRAGGMGFSGAGIWRVETPSANYALRRWPPGEPDERRLEFIHRVIDHAQRHGAPPLAAPIPTDRGATWVNSLNHLWELSPWLAGAADYRLHPSDDRLTAALSGLARFHVATRDFAPQRGPSPGIKYRLQLVRRIDAIAAAWHNSRPDWPTVDVRHRIGELLLPLLAPLPPGVSPLGCFLTGNSQTTGDSNHSLQDRSLAEFGQTPDAILLHGAAAPKHAGHSWGLLLQTACERSWSLQPCLRDIWHAHVFFQGDRLTGLIDFGAVNWEHPAADVGRLLGSLVGHDWRGWATGLTAYQEVWSLEPAEIELAQLFHACNVHLAGLSWADWIYVQGREFGDWSAVALRLDELQKMAQPTSSHSTTTTPGQLWLPPSPD